MKVYIGKYRDHWTTQNVERLWYSWRYDKMDFEIENPDWIDGLFELTMNFWRAAVCRPVNWINSKIPRTTIIKIDKYDSWNAEHTIALIVLPILKQLQATKHGAPFTDDDDVPLFLRSTEAEPKEHEWDADSLHFKRWDWILNEMIWTFEQLASDDDEDQFYHHEFGEHDKVPEGWCWVKSLAGLGGFWVDQPGEKAHHERIGRGLRLFGRYYRALWD